MKQGLYQLNDYVELSEILKVAVTQNYLSEDRSESEFYSNFYNNPDLYLVKVSSEFKENLQRLRAGGKKLVVVTNSYEDYINFIFSYAFGDDWHSYFDAYVFAAGKPEFFYKDDELERIENLNLDGEAFKRGSSKNLKETLGGHKYVFIGDHYVGDVHSPKLINWKTIALVEEIYFEKSIVTPESPETIENALYSQANGDSLAYFPTWGSHFKQDDKKTYWWDFLLTHADVIVPNLESVISVLE